MYEVNKKESIFSGFLNKLEKLSVQSFETNFQDSHCCRTVLFGKLACSTHMCIMQFFNSMPRLMQRFCAVISEE